MPATKSKRPSTAVTGISETVAGISSQIDQLVAIIQDASAPASDRIASAEVVRSFVEFQSLSSITEIWYGTSSLLELSNPTEVRRAGWRLLHSCISHDEVNNSAFTAYYSAVVRNANVEDFDLVLSTLELLTNNGRRVVGSQAPRQLPQVLIGWIELLAVRAQQLRTNSGIQSASAGNSGSMEDGNTDSNSSLDVAVTWGGTEANFHALMRYTIGVLKFRMSIWEPADIEKLLLVSVAVVRQTSQPVDCELCILVIQTVMAFGLIPAPVLQPVLEVLCGVAVVVKQLRDQCIASIRGLSKSHLHNSTFVRLCRILDSPNAEITLSMRAEAALRLNELASDASSTVDLSGSNETPSLLGNNASTMESDLPVTEVLECYLKTLRSPETPLRLIVTLLECFSEQVIEHHLLNRVSRTTWGVSADMVYEFSARYTKVKSEIKPEEKEDLETFHSRLTNLARFLSTALLDKSLGTSTTEHVLLCTRLAPFLDPASCSVLLDAIDFLQFCTPGVANWFDHLQLVVNQLYTSRTDNVRARVLRIVRNMYALDIGAEEQDWISPAQLEWITKTTFSALPTSDSETLGEILSLYEQQVFYSDIKVFTKATKLLAEAVTGPNVNAIIALPQRVMDSLTQVLSRTFKTRGNYALVVLTTLRDLCGVNTDPDVFTRAWSILCRLRVNRWDQLTIVDHLIETSYGSDLTSVQEPLPKQLQSIQSVPSLTLKGLYPETRDWPFTFDFVPLFKIILDVIRAPDVNERIFVMVLLNAVPQLGHYRLLQSGVGSEECFNVVCSLRDELTSFLASGNASLPCKSMQSSRRSACLCVVVHTLTVLMPYSPLYPKPEQNRLIHVLVQALSQWNLPTAWATHCFSVACYMASSSLQRYLPQIVSRLQLKITARDSTMYILDFLLSLSLEGSLTNSFNELDYKRLFGMCFSFIQNTHHLLMFTKKGDITAQWLLRLAYSAICHLFLSMSMETRRSLVPYLIRSLVLANGAKNEMDSMSLVVYDMILRFTYSDMPLRANMSTVPVLNPEWETRRWLWNLSVLELRCNRRTGENIKIIRRPAGITAVESKPLIAEPMISAPTSTDNYTSNFFLLSSQLGLGSLQCENENIVNTVTGLEDKTPVLGSTLPLSLPDDAATTRAVSAIDRVPILDFYKIGIVYVGPGQRTESQILANQSGSECYHKFLNDIGVLIRLKHNKQYYVGGLDTDQDLDGEFAMAWSSRISQIIFHTTTMMPKYEGDAAFASKKRHIGNNYVNIYFDESGEDFDFDLVKSQFNFINIVITPTYTKGPSKYWKLRAYKKPGMLNTLVAYDLKVVSEENLALFTRNLALKASQYASIHNAGGEFTDNWVYRLQLISTLRERAVKQQLEQKEKKEQEKPEQDDEITSFVNEDDFDEDLNKGGDIELLKWLDFTQYTHN